MRLLLIICCVWFLLVVSGCEAENELALKRACLETAGKANGEFPEYLAGVWKADRYKWAIKIEPDGTISKMVHNLAGPVVINEGGFELEGRQEGTFAIFLIGPCQAKYDENSKKLSVKLFLDLFHMKLPQGVLQGRSEDYFEGIVSKDGKMWYANWRSYGWLEEATLPDPEEIEANPVKLLFSKVEFDVDMGADEYDPNS